MSPPDMINNKYPNILYNAGGIIINLILVLIFYFIRFKTNNYYSDFFAYMMIICGIHFIILNGIPFKNNDISNDGYNILCLNKDEKTRIALWILLRINACFAKGIRLKDMDEDLFNNIDDNNKDNSIVTSLLCLKENRYMDQKDFVKAKEYINLLLSDNVVINAINKYLLELDQIYIDIINHNEITNNILENKETDRLIKATNNYLSVIRSLYTYYLVHDTNKALELEKHFNKIAPNYPNPIEIESEKELMLLAKERLTK